MMIGDRDWLVDHGHSLIMAMDGDNDDWLMMMIVIDLLIIVMIIMTDNWLMRIAHGR